MKLLSLPRLRTPILLAFPLWATLSSMGQTTVVFGWGANRNGETVSPPGLTNIVAVSASSGGSYALRASGTVVSWGFPLSPPMPLGLSNVMAIDAGRGHMLALRSNGTVVAWGDNLSGETQVPAGLSNVIAISAGGNHSLAVTADGTVVGWGGNSFGQISIPPGLSNVIAVSAGGNSSTAWSVALKSDGTVVAWGNNRQLQTNVPPGLSNVVAIAASSFLHSIGLKSDGTVVAWGVGLLATNVPAGLSNVVAISAGSGYSLALRVDGTIVAWGDDFEGETNVPPSARNITAIASGWFHNVAVRRQTPPRWPRIVEQPRGARILVGQPVVLSITATSSVPVSYRWQFRGRDIPGATNAVLRLDEPQLSAAGDYAVVVSADGLSVRSAPAFVEVRDPPVATSMAVAGVEDRDTVVTLGGFDPSGLPLVAKVVSLPEEGELYQYSSGTRGNRIETVPAMVTDPAWRLFFVPATNQAGAGSSTILFTLGNEIGDSAPGVVFINLQPVNDPPAFMAGADQVVPEDAGPQSVSGWATAVRAGPPDEVRQVLTFLVTNDNGALFAQGPTIDEAGNLAYTAAPDAFGTATVRVQLKDNGGSARGGIDISPAQIFTINVTPVNDAPVAHSDSVSLNEDESIPIALAAMDVDGDSLTFNIGPPGHGSLSGTAPNLVYRPATDYFGPDSFTFSVNDGQVGSAMVSVIITVRPVNDSPVATARAFSGTLYSRDDPGHVVVLASNSSSAVVVLDGSHSNDPEDDPLEYFWFELGGTIPFAAGVRVTNVFEIGSHTIVLKVSDGSTFASSSVTLDVITPGEAIDELLLVLVNTPGMKGKGRPLVATLKAAIASFDRGNVGAGLNQLHAVQNKIRAQVGRESPILAEEWMLSVQRIVDSLNGR